MSHRFDEQLTRLKDNLVSMGALAESMIRNTIGSLVTRDAGLIEKVLEAESRMDVFEREIDNETVRLIGVYTPVAADLRTLLMVTRINAQLERIGDHAVAICYTIENLLKEEQLKPLVDLPRMAELAAQMLHDALDAFVARSPERAMEVIHADDQADQLNDQIFRELLTYMMSDPRNIGRALGLILTARAFERIADHAVNIAEDVIYMISGEDIRHIKPDGAG